jgi:uncharacterized RDD family membrane protein YckC
MDSQNPYAPPSANVQDVYVPGSGGEPADRGIRLAAYIVDALIASAMIYGPFLVAFAIGAASGSGGDGPMSTGMLAGLILGCVGFIVWAWLMIRGVSRSGQSIAKKMLGIRVVRSDGSQATPGRIFWLRNVVNSLICIVPFYGLIDILFIFAEDRQCLHDKLADTIVVKA